MTEPLGLPADDRGVSTALGYVLTLSISAVLVSTLLFGAGTLVESQQERVIRSELEVVGQGLAADVQTADRLVEAGGSATDAEVETDLPGGVAGSRYDLTVEPGDRSDVYVLVLESRDPSVVVEVSVRSRTPLATDAGPVPGGDLVVGFDAERGRLEVRSGA